MKFSPSSILATNSSLGIFSTFFAPRKRPNPSKLIIQPKRSFEGRKLKLVVQVRLFLMNLARPSDFSRACKNVRSFFTRLNSRMLLLLMCKLVSNAIIATRYRKITKCAKVNDLPSYRLACMIYFYSTLLHNSLICLKFFLFYLSLRSAIVCQMKKQVRCDTIKGLTLKSVQKSKQAFRDILLSSVVDFLIMPFWELMSISKQCEYMLLSKGVISVKTASVSSL